MIALLFFFNTRYIKLINVMRMSYFLLCTINLNAVRFWYIPQEMVIYYDIYFNSSLGECTLNFQPGQIYSSSLTMKVKVVNAF